LLGGSKSSGALAAICENSVVFYTHYNRIITLSIWERLWRYANRFMRGVVVESEERSSGRL